jgi:hypothetical protein
MDSSHHSFFQKNKIYTQQLNRLPSLTMSDEEIALWMLQGGHGDWIELDLQINTSSWIAEYHTVQDMFVPHRDIDSGEGTHQGWSACTLHGISYDKTNVWQEYGYKTEPEYNWTQAGKKCPSIKSAFESLPAEHLARVRFMKLDAGGWISPHNDLGPGINWNKIFDYPLPMTIAVDHPQECYMTLENRGVVPFKNNKAFLVNILNNHSVINFSKQDRIHVIGHLFVGNRKKEYCKLLADSYRKSYVLQR